MRHSAANLASVASLALVACGLPAQEFPCAPGETKIHLAKHVMRGYPSDPEDDTISAGGCYEGTAIALHQQVSPESGVYVELHTDRPDGSGGYFRSRMGNPRQLQSFYFRSSSGEPQHVTSGPEFDGAQKFYNTILEEAHGLAREHLQNIGNY